MLKKRMLLLGVAVTSLGAILASAALANPTASDVTGPSGTVTVLAPTILADIVNGTSVIPANGVAQDVGDVNASEPAPTAYGNLVVTGVAITATGVAAVPADCGAFAYTLTNVVTPLLTVVPALVADLNLSIASTGTASACSISGATVTVDAQAT